MVWNFMSDDPFNILGLRNIDNTNRCDYNCGGYALETFSWYCPFKGYSNIDLRTERDYKKIERIAVKQMLKEIPGLKRISDKAIRNYNFDIEKYSVIAFRFSDSDFHFYKLGKNFCWYEKRGRNHEIYRHKYNEVWDNWGWHGEYNGKIYFFLKAR